MHCQKLAGHFGHKTLRHQDILGHFNTTKLVPKFKTNHRWSCVSSELSWVEVCRLFLDHGTRVEVSRTTFLVSKCLETGAEVSQSVLMPKCLVAKVSGNLSKNCAKLFSSTVKMFGSKMAKSFREVHSLSTSPNLHQRTTVLNADVPNCYLTL